MAEKNENENGTGKVEEATGLSDAWLNDEDDDVEEDAESVYGGGGNSMFIEGYGAQDVKITMAKHLTFPKSKVEFIQLDFINKEEQTLSEKYMLRGKDGKTFYKRGNKKANHFGIPKIKSLLKILGLYQDENNVMAALFGDTEEAEITFTEYGAEKTEDATVFKGLLGKKVKVCVSSKKVNSQVAADREEGEEYIKSCIKDTETFKKAHPKKKSAQKFKKDDAYVNVYKWYVESEVKHFCSLEGKFAAELDGEGVMLQQYLDANDDGAVFDMRTLIVEELSDAKKEKYSINDYGKEVDSDSSDDGYDEPEEEASEESDSDDSDW